MPFANENCFFEFLKTVIFQNSFQRTQKNSVNFLLISFKGCPMQTQLLSASVSLCGPVQHFYALLTSTLSLQGRTSGGSGKTAIIKFKTTKKSFSSFPIPWKISALLSKENCICKVHCPDMRNVTFPLPHMLQAAILPNAL